MISVRRKGKEDIATHENATKEYFSPKETIPLIGHKESRPEEPQFEFRNFEFIIISLAVGGNCAFPPTCLHQGKRGS